MSAGGRLDYGIKALALFAAYLVTARLGLALDAVSGFATFVWPPAGIALFGVLRLGHRFWPTVFFGTLIADVLVGAPVWSAAGIGVGNTAAAVLASVVLKRIGFEPGLGRVRDVGAFVLIAVLLNSTISSTMGVTCL